MWISVDNDMTVTKNNVVAVSYVLHVEGKIADSASEEKPLEYIHGTGMLLPKFEAALEGKTVGDTFAFTLAPEEGYGEYHPEYRVEIPKSAFSVEGVVREDLLVVGQMIPMYNGSGEVVQGVVAEVGTDTVVMDFNHPMAGKTLDFTGKVVSVRAATEKELTEGLHGEYLPREEGCHCHGGCHKDGGCHGEGECHKDGGCHKDGECHCKN